MHFISAFLNIVILLGAVQGFILSSLLFFSRRRLPNRFLAWLIFFIALASFKLYGVMQGWFDTGLLHLVDTFVPLIIVMPAGPLILFYVKSSLDPDFKLTKKGRAHFYPVIIDLVPQLTAVIFIMGLLTNTVKNNPSPWGNFIDTYNVYADIPRWLSLSLYSWMAWREISAVKTTPGQVIAQQPDLIRWLTEFVRLFLVFQSIWLIFLIPYIIPKYTDVLLNGVDWYPVYVPLAILVYWLSIRGYIMSQREFTWKKISAGQSILPPSLVEQVTASLVTAMEKDKLYLNPTLSVAILAGHTGIVQKNISAVLNQHLHKSFSEFVNEYRVNAIKDRLLKGETKHLTIAGMAYECGFNSVPTFQRAFKAIVGQTPKEFLSQKA